MSKNFKKIFEPIKIGRVEIKNRIAMAPMGILGLINPDGSPGPRAIDYYLERARGGVGLIITSVFKVENEIDSMLPVFPLLSFGALSPLTELAEAVHALGTKVFVQLTAGVGRVGTPRVLRGQPVSASAIPNYWQPDVSCRELRTEEVEKFVASFGLAAQILAFAGIDGIELHGHEGYLLDQFTASIWNKRTDQYGGSLAGRLKFPVEVLREIKKRVGDDFPVTYRFGLKHYIKGLNTAALPAEKYTEAGRDIEEGLQMARMLEEAGFDGLHVDAGCYDSWYWAHPPTYQEHGCMVEMAARVKKVVKVPVIAVGRLEIPELAEKVLEEGKADIVALGRGLLTDPFWVRKVAEGRPEKIRPCLGCHDGCLGRIFSGKPLSCTVNPAAGREKTYASQRAEEPKKVIVAGGGVAGLEAARTASLRGHRVILYEKAQVLGGCLVPGSVPPFKRDLQDLLRWYESELRDCRVGIKLGNAATSDIIENEKADVVIIATGGKAIIPSVPGIAQENVATASEVLLGKKPAGEKVAVVGGGLVGCETAIWLAQQGKRITLVEMLPELMIRNPVPHANRMMVLDMLRFNRVEIMTGARLAEVTADGLLIETRSEKKDVKGDTIVLAIGLEPDEELYRALLGKIPNLYLIGDAREARNIMGAIWDAYEVARAI